MRHVGVCGRMALIATALCLAGCSAASTSATPTLPDAIPTGHPTPTPAQAATYLDNNCHAARAVRPRQMLYFCGDAGVMMQHIRWRSWSQQRAQGTVGRVVAKGV